MSRFRVCARRAARAEDPRPSHAFIALLRCVEGLARLTGEPYSAIVERLGAAHGFGTSPRSWPRAAQIRAAVAQLVEEREAWLADYRAHVAARKARKALGDRRRGGPLESLERRRRRHDECCPHVGYWGWRALHEGPPRLVPSGVEPRHAVYRLPGGHVLIDLRGSEDVAPSVALVDWCTRVFRQPGVDAWRSALLADARVWATWCSLESASLASGVGLLRRAGVRELWLIGVSAESESDTLATLQSCELPVRELHFDVPRGSTRAIR